MKFLIVALMMSPSLTYARTLKEVRTVKGKECAKICIKNNACGNGCLHPGKQCTKDPKVDQWTACNVADLDPK